MIAKSHMFQSFGEKKEFSPVFSANPTLLLSESLNCLQKVAKTYCNTQNIQHIATPIHIATPKIYYYKNEYKVKLWEMPGSSYVIWSTNTLKNWPHPEIDAVLK